MEQIYCVLKTYVVKLTIFCVRAKAIVGALLRRRLRRRRKKRLAEDRPFVFEVKNPFCILKYRKGFVMAKTKGHAIIFTEITFCLPH